MVPTEEDGGHDKVLSIDAIACNWRQWVELLLRLAEVREVAAILRRTRKKGKRALSEKDEKSLTKLESTILNLRFQGRQLQVELRGFASRIRDRLEVWRVEIEQLLRWEREGGVEHTLEVQEDEEEDGEHSLRHPRRRILPVCNYKSRGIQSLEHTLWASRGPITVKIRTKT